MNKNELLRELSSRLHTPQKESKRHLEALLEILEEELDSNNKLMLQGFGTFTLWQQTLRTGRNPRTGSLCPIPPRKSVKFKPGKYLLAKLNREEITG